MLDKQNLAYRVEYLTYIPYIRKIMPNSIRMLFTRIVSFPWQKSKGNVIIILGTKL
ncbi:MAG: hypothetical protein MUP19_02600 [Candidatus Aminicenantes bacterium]|nr:hypothetical protein [Candidatus Aminicenantes bacterium]